MEPLQGTNVAPALVEIAARAIEDRNKLEMAKAETVMDTVREGGELLVYLLEGLGENIDTYA